MKPSISYDPGGCIGHSGGITREQLNAISEKVIAARDEVFNDDLALFNDSASVPPHKQPLDAGFIEMPKRLLEHYRSNRATSEIELILTAAKRIREQVDQIVLLGIGGSYMGARVLKDTCCHPFHNELPRSARGGKPRLYFEGYNVDNDSLSGLLDLLNQRCQFKAGAEDRWGIVVISKSGGTLETAAAFRIFLDELAGQVSAEQLQQLVIPVTGKSGKLADLANSIGCNSIFEVPDGVGGRFSVFSAVGLLPAAILGIDIVALLDGAAAMTEQTREGQPGMCAALDYVAVNHLMEQTRATHTRILSVWNNSLESTGLWYDQLLAESLGKKELGALPLTVVNTRDLHSRAQQHQEGRRDKVINNLIVEKSRTDAITIQNSERNEDQLNQFAGKSYPQFMKAAIEGTNVAYQSDSRPTADIRMDSTSEYNMGQLLQMFMLATVIEGRLIGVNPYGQPGVEGYKQNMQRILKSPQPSEV
jgi:glucose-6-phosphate isomerase